MSDISDEPEDVLLAATTTLKNRKKRVQHEERERSGNLTGQNILAFAFRNVVIHDNKWSADCMHCLTRPTKHDKKGTTSNFLSHVRQVHPEVFDEYLKQQVDRPPRGTKLKEKLAKRIKKAKRTTTATVVKVIVVD